MVRTFLLSKRSLKKKYGLNLGNVAILRYICDAIDLNFSKRKTFQVKMYQGQIATYTHCTSKTARVHLSHLIKKRFLKFDDKRHIYTVGSTLKAWVKFTYGIDIGKIYLGVRCRENLPTSDFSDFTTRAKYSKSENHKKKHKNYTDQKYSPHPTAPLPVGSILAEFMNKKKMEKKK